MRITATTRPRRDGEPDVSRRVHLCAILIALAAIHLPVAGWAQPAQNCLPDVNGDGHPLFGNPEFPVGSLGVVSRQWRASPTRVAFGDLNQDGILDLVTANSDPVEFPEPNGDVSVLFGVGDGTFLEQTGYGAETYPIDVEIGDLDADGDLDLAVLNGFIGSADPPATVSILLNNGDGTFAAQVSYQLSGYSGRDSAMADLNGDGDLDLVVVTLNRCQIYDPFSAFVLLNNGDGSFAAARPYDGGGSGTSAVAIGDVDGDGNLDLALRRTGCGATGFSILLGNGDGTFAPARVFPEGGIGPSLALSDFDEDGDLDVAINNRHPTGSGDGTVGIYLNDGAGMFSGFGPSYPVGELASVVADIVVADFDGDGHTDLAVGNSARQTDGGRDDVSVLLGNGDGTFNPEQRYSANGEPSGLAVADVDGDGDLDLAVANHTGSVANGVASILLNSGDGTFGSDVQYAAGNLPGPLTIGDLNGDGALDLAVVNKRSANISVFLNQGDGTMAAQQLYIISSADGAADLVSADFDGDGDLDLALGNRSGWVEVLFNRGDGSFGLNHQWINLSNPTYLTAADLDGDGDVDLAVVNELERAVRIVVNNGNGTFTLDPTPYPANTHGQRPYDLTAADLDGDGDIDLAVAHHDSNRASGTLAILRNDGSGAFTLDAELSASFVRAYRLNHPVAADLDNNGSMDLLVMSNTYADAGRNLGTIIVFLNDGSGTFQAPRYYEKLFGSSVPDFPALGDFDNDGDLDLATLNHSNGNTSIFLNDGSGSFAPEMMYGLGAPHHSGVLVSGDFDGDGRLDLARTNGSGNLRRTTHNTLLILFNRACGITIPGDLNCDGLFNGGDIDPFFLALGDPPAYAIAFPNCDPHNGDMNNDGRLDGADIDPFFACLGGVCP